MIRDQPKVSIGLPVFNSERWIQRTIQSLLGQTYENFELVIVDNCSTDRTFEICKDIAATDPRIRLSRNARNIGGANNYNEVFRQSRGEYFKLAASNDLCADTLLEKCVSVLEAHPDFVLCYGKTRLIDEADRVIEDYEDGFHLDDDDPVERYRRFRSRARLNNIEQGVIRSRVLAKSKLKRNFESSDIVLLAELALYGKFYEYPEFLFYRRISPEASTKLMTPEQRADFYTPGKSRIPFQGVRRRLAYGSNIYRVQLSREQRLKLSLRFLREVYWHVNRVVTSR